MTSTFSATKAAAFADNNTGSPLAKRTSIETFAPSTQPSVRMPVRKSSTDFGVCSRESGASTPTRGTPESRCAKDKASGTQLIQELIADGCHSVTRYQPTTDKIMRMHAQTAMIENGFVYIPQSAPWLAEYLHEMTVFPNGKHDDQVDATAQFLEWFQKPFPGQNVFEYYQKEAAKLKQQGGEPVKRKPPRPVNVRIKAPPGIGAAQTFSGRHINIGPDGIVEMSEEDAFYFTPAGWTILGDAT